MLPEKRQLKLNILALPNQQVVIVSMLFLVVFGTLLAIGFNAPPWLFFTLALLLLVLSFRQVLVDYESDARFLHLHEASPEFAPLQMRVHALAVDTLGMQQGPRLAIAQVECTPRIVSTWRRRYVALDEARARRAVSILDDPVKSAALDILLLHELHHLRHNDHLWIAYARALLHIGVRVILWFALLLIGLVSLLALIQRSFFTNVTPEQIGAIADSLTPGLGDSVITVFFGSTEAYNRLAAQYRTIDFGQVLFTIILNTLPYLLIGSGLLVFFWQRLLRLREVYADAGAVQVSDHPEAMGRAISAVDLNPSEINEPHGIAGVLEKLQLLYGRYIQRLNLEPRERIRFLNAPEQVNGSPRAYGFFIGLFVLALNLIMSSTGAFSLIGSWPMHFPVITATALIGLYLLTPLALGQSFSRPLWSALLVVVALHSGALMLSLGILATLAAIDPQLMLTLLESTARGFTWYTRIDPTFSGQNPSALLATALFANLIQIPVVLAFSAGSLWLFAHLAGRMFTWYGLPRAEKRLIPAMLLVLGCIIAVVALVILPPVTDIMLRPTDPISLYSLSYKLLAVCTLVVTAVVSIRFIQLDKRFAGRCPHCGKSIPGSFALGKRCPYSNELLYPWLGVVYDIDPKPQASHEEEF